jgi:hypothetical protein
MKFRRPVNAGFCLFSSEGGKYRIAYGATQDNAITCAEPAGRHELKLMLLFNRTVRLGYS